MACPSDRCGDGAPNGMGLKCCVIVGWVLSNCGRGNVSSCVATFEHFCGLFVIWLLSRDWYDYNGCSLLWTYSLLIIIPVPTAYYVIFCLKTLTEFSISGLTSFLFSPYVLLRYLSICFCHCPLASFIVLYLIPHSPFSLICFFCCPILFIGSLFPVKFSFLSALFCIFPIRPFMASSPASGSVTSLVTGSSVRIPLSYTVEQYIDQEKPFHNVQHFTALANRLRVCQSFTIITLEILGQ